MKIALITGSSGLIGSESVRFFSNKGFQCVGIDNDMRKVFFGKSASTDWNRKLLEKTIPNFVNHSIDIRNMEGVFHLFKEYGADIEVVIHTAAQPSHDWAAKEPLTDFAVNALGTLNLLEATRKYSPDAAFIFTSTNKVYGDTPNRLPLIEQDTRYEIDPDHPYHANGIDESMSIDNTLHSVFGASKVAADVLVQEYGKYFGMKTVCFRGGCLTGPNHSGAELHGFLSYLVKCAFTGTPYRVFGYKSKQVRDNIHSFDLVNMFWHFFQNPKEGEVYNAGGSRHSNVSLMEAATLCKDLFGKKLKTKYLDEPRRGDHMWWISDVSKFKNHYPKWDYTYDLEKTILEIGNHFA